MHGVDPFHQRYIGDYRRPHSARCAIAVWPIFKYCPSLVRSGLCRCQSDDICTRLSSACACRWCTLYESRLVQSLFRRLPIFVQSRTESWRSRICSSGHRRCIAPLRQHCSTGDDPRGQVSRTSHYCADNGVVSIAPRNDGAQQASAVVNYVPIRPPLRLPTPYPSIPFLATEDTVSRYPWPLPQSGTLSSEDPFPTTPPREQTFWLPLQSGPLQETPYPTLYPGLSSVSELSATESHCEVVFPSSTVLPDGRIR